MKSLRCCCGEALDAETGEDLLAAVEAHIADSHSNPPDGGVAHVEAKPGRTARPAEEATLTGG